MNKLFIPLILSFFCFLSSCKKEEAAPLEYLNFKFNQGVIKCDYFSYFSSSTSAADIPDLTITGNSGQARITLWLYPDSGFVVPGTYEFKPDNRSRSMYVTPPITIFGFNIQLEYYGGASFDQTQFYGPGKITITQIDGGFIKGTFEFTDTTSNSNDPAKFSEGKFSLRRR